jgi:hypothetical protein
VNYFTAFFSPSGTTRLRRLTDAHLSIRQPQLEVSKRKQKMLKKKQTEYIYSLLTQYLTGFTRDDSSFS